MAIILALGTRSVFIALISSIIIGEWIIADFGIGGTLLYSMERFWALLSEGWVLKTLAFAVMVGSVMTLIERSGGVEGLVHELSVNRSLVRSKRGALIPSFIAGLVVFVESSITSLVAGAVGRPFCDRYGVSRAKLAFVCDSTSAPVCSIIAINGWGALLMGLIGTQIGSGLIQGKEAEWLMESILYNFYAFAALIVTFVAIWYSIDIGPMRFSEVKNPDEIECVETKGSIGYFVWPMVWMIGGVLGFMLWTGGGNLLEGSGSSSIFYTLVVTLVMMFVYYRLNGVMGSSDFLKASWDGAKNMVPIASILLLAFAIGGVTSDMGVGKFLATFVGNYLPSAYVAAAIFVLSGIIAFATGTSWGTFSIMLPIAVPLAVGLDAPVALAMGAVISGGVFGDHCSPISDTTIISAMASGCDVIEHTRTQLPYALISAMIALVLFVLFGVILS